MREILFRGKRLGNGEWVEGYYVYDDSGQTKEEPIAYIYYLNKHTCGWDLIPFEVDPSTVGQYTGLLANGKRIFEGDIIRWLPAFEEKTDVVFFDEAGFVAGKYFLQSALYYGDFDGEVIGNIYDNPELAGGSNG